MTIIEAMAKAAWEKQHGSRIWETRVSQGHKQKFCEYMRAALLALAECETPLSALDAAETAVENCRADEFMDVAFRAIIRAIAEDKSNG
jgi:hypothetical protein